MIAADERADREFDHVQSRGDVALFGHFFGGKQGVFEEAVMRRCEASIETVVNVELEEEPDSQLLDLYFSMWENPATSLVVRALFRASPESEERHGKLQSGMRRTTGLGLRLITEQRDRVAHHAQYVRSSS